VNPLVSFQIEEVNYRTHRKALVVDGDVAFVGGMGIADQWAHDAKDFPMWRDTMVEMHGPAVDDVDSAFNQNWIVVGGVVEPEGRAHPGHAVRAGQIDRRLERPAKRRERAEAALPARTRGGEALESTSNRPI
jgi:cardiolipin synthase